MRARSFSRNEKAALLVVLAVTVVFGRALFFGFTNWDDDVNIYRNPHHLPVTLSGILSLWTGAFEHFYTPLTYTVWAVIAAVSPHLPAHAPYPEGAPAPILFHLAGLIFHSGCGYLVYVFLDRLLGRLGVDDPAARFSASLMGALLFVVHPAQAEPVAWSSGMRDTLSGLLSLLCLNEYLAYLEGGATRRYRIALGAFIAALLVKASAVTVPCVAGSIAYLVYRRTPKALLSDFAPYLGIIVPYVLLTKQIQRNDVDVVTPYLLRPFVMLDSFSFYFGKLLWPFPLTVNYGRTPLRIFHEGWIPLTAIPPVFLALSIRRWPEKYRGLGYLCFALFFWPILPVSGILPFVSQNQSSVYDRYLYLALLGPILALAYALAKRPTGKLVQVSGALIVFFAAGAFVQTGYWRNAETLFAHQTDVLPHFTGGERSLALFYEQSEMPEKAREHFQRAVDIDPTDEWAQEHRDSLSPERVAAKKEIDEGVKLAQSQHLDEAAKHFEAALRLDGKSVGALTNLGNIHAMRGDIDAAIKDFEKAIAADPRAMAPYRNLANSYHLKGDDAKAREVVRRAAALTAAPR